MSIFAFLAETFLISLEYSTNLLNSVEKLLNYLINFDMRRSFNILPFV